MNLEEAVKEIIELDKSNQEWNDNMALGGGSMLRSILSRLIASVQEETLERAAMRAGRCYHGPGDYGCSHGGEIAAEIRALKAAPKTEER